MTSAFFTGCKCKSEGQPGFLHAAEDEKGTICVRPELCGVALIKSRVIGRQAVKTMRQSRSFIPAVRICAC